MQFIAGLAVSAAFPSQASARTEFSRDAAGCLVVPVRINGRGPYLFVLDTGSNRTVITPELANELGLAISNGGQRIVGVGGSASAGMTRLDHIDAGALQVRGVTAMVIANDRTMGPFGAAQGALGMDGLAGKRLVIDLERGDFEIESGGDAAPRGYEIVPGRLRFGHLLEIPIDIGGFAARAVIDTGTQATIANAPLLAQGVATTAPQRFALVGANGAAATSQAALLREIKLGPLMINRLLAQPGELPVLRGEDGKALPALFLGMDALGQTKGFAIDFARAELQVRLDPLQLAWLRWTADG
ncbi:MAG TPA: aspartyl protease family protein [Caulobacterales bacterium]|nr:aspartyl protease family protein [Caulobacterales bacterium]